jgi:hypothetical protein
VAVVEMRPQAECYWGNYQEIVDRTCHREPYCRGKKLDSEEYHKDRFHRKHFHRNRIDRIADLHQNDHSD